MEDKKHYAAAILAFVIWGFFSIALKSIKEYSAGNILYFRILFSFILLLFVVPVFRWKHLKRDRDFYKSLTRKQQLNVLFLTISGSILLTFNWLTFIYTVNSINVKTASFAYLICPVITAILGYILLREKITLLQWISVSLCCISCAMLGMGSWLELQYSFVTALSYALYLISQRKNQGFDRLNILGIQIFISFVMLSLFSGHLNIAVPVALNFYVIITVIAICFTILPLFLNLFALNRINSATIGILMYINPILNFAIAFMVFDERMGVLHLLSYGLIAVALVLFNYSNLKKYQYLKMR